MNKEFLIDYLSTNSPSTYELEGQLLWKNYLSKYVDNFHVDNYGSIAAIIHNNDIMAEKFKVVIEAHADEIGFIVNNITDDGYINVIGNGGIDYNIVPGTHVNIMGNNGLIKGVFGWVPVHLIEKEDKLSPKQDNVFIDIGASSKEEVTEMGIELGQFIVFNRKPEIINNKIFSKSLDNKIGGYIIAEVARKLKEENIKLPYDLYIINAVQEEVGLRGARMITEQIKPDIAICIDVCHDTNIPLIDKKKHGDYKIGEGIVITQSPAIQRNFLKLMKDTAKENDIKFKLEINKYNTGTDTDAYNLSNGGVISGLISVPVKYMHTPNEVASLDDVQNAIDFYFNLLQNIQHQHDFKYF
ncbi:M20/M25/M40 family metallo-hydrolase [Trichloromonas sp.]|uniref:M20/M25/M40 family metallo-hydrolase n=1 Tax=Trichloromonas sp. TaxID=3069249 RepID=UPI002A4DD5B3|nr:M20/M25/M40 family metallo-hydrolase [Trichloromonas sp.]